jgi:non-ribosomal peptide synthetase component F
MFTYHNAPTVLPALPGLALRLVESAVGEAMFDLSLALVESQRRLRMIFEYSTELFSRAAARRLLGHFASLLESAIGDPEQAIEALPLLTETERHQLLLEWNDTGPEPEPEACLHELFEAQARRTPEAVALIDGTREISYRELDQEADRLADHLRHLDAGPEVVVGVSLERSARMVATLLGILKAGAAYLPLDPGLPRRRLEAMMADARVGLVVDETFPLSRLAGGGGRGGQGVRG